MKYRRTNHRRKSKHTAIKWLLTGMATYLFFSSLNHDIRQSFHLMSQFHSFHYPHQNNYRNDHSWQYSYSWQTSPDREMQRIHLAPVMGGKDLVPPYFLAAGDDGEIALMPSIFTYDRKARQSSSSSSVPPSTNSTIKTIHRKALPREIHGYENDAVFSIANTLNTSELVLFVTSLRASGFEGDIVLSTIDFDEMEDIMREFIAYHAQPPPPNSGMGRLIVYEGVMRVEGTDEAFGQHHSVIEDEHHIYLRGLYKDSLTQEHLDDKRDPRSIGVARFELFWVWSTFYSKQSRILVVDAQDTYFQQNGEEGIGIGQSCPSSSSPKDKNATDSFRTELHLYEENQRSGKHRLHNIPNRTQMVLAYQNRLVLDFACNENVLSPANTHGHQQAMEVYFRAMVKQLDYTQCRKYWCEWAFHNYLFYLGVLGSLNRDNMDEKGYTYGGTIDSIKVHGYATGAVNSIGEDVPLNQSGLMDVEMYENDDEDNDAPSVSSYVVHNRPMGNGRQASWAVHQYKRDEQLYGYVNETKVVLMHDLDFMSHPLDKWLWKGRESISDGSNDIGFKDSNSTHTLITAKPSMGQHRRNVDAIMSVISGRDLNQLVLFVVSVRRTGFNGDIVLHTPYLNTLSDDVKAFLNAQNNHIVLYEGWMVKKEKEELVLRHGFYANAKTRELIKDPRPPRSVHAVRFELFSAWSSYYHPGSTILLIDGESSYFQQNPFAQKLCDLYELHVYQEHTTIHKMNDKSLNTAMSTMFTKQELDITYQKDAVVTPHAIMGHREIIQELAMEMAHAMHQFQCTTEHIHCDWAAMNYVWYKKGLSKEQSISYELESHNFGLGKVLLPMELLDQMKKRKLFMDDGRGGYTFRLWDGSVAPIVLRYNEFPEVNTYFGKVAKEFLGKDD